MEFRSFDKIPRLTRTMVITEKIDGTNAQIAIDEDGTMFVGSRTRWITPENDNCGFARWARKHEAELMLLGPGRHFGEWWGAGIQRRYGMKEKRFSLFNVGRWLDIQALDRYQYAVEPAPLCCGVVPIMYHGEFSTDAVDRAIQNLGDEGSKAAPGFMDPEGVVIFHEAAGKMFKKTIKNDEKAKGAAQ